MSNTPLPQDSQARTKMRRSLTFRSGTLMTAKSKSPHPFKVGDPARVVDTRDGTIVDRGLVENVNPGWTTFRSVLLKNRIFKYRRKGVDWIEAGKDHFHLEAC